MFLFIDPKEFSVQFFSNHVQSNVGYFIVFGDESYKKNLVISQGL